MPLSDELSDSLLEQGIDVRNRLVYLDEEISHATFLKIFKAVTLFKDAEPFSVIINSDGGSYYDSMAIADLISATENAHTVGVGRVLSAALLILAAGKQRFVSKSCWLMYHNSSYGQEGSHMEIKASVEQAEREEIQSAEFMASRTKKSRKFWKQISDTKDYYFSSKEALKLGVVDHVT